MVKRGSQVTEELFWSEASTVPNAYALQDVLMGDGDGGGRGGGDVCAFKRKCQPTDHFSPIQNYFAPIFVPNQGRTISQSPGVIRYQFWFDGYSNILYFNT